MTSRSDLSTKVPVDGNVPAKAFVLEVHTDDPDAYLAEIAGRGNVQDTDDAFLSRVFAPSDGEFWVDRLQPRFWVFHTTWASALAAAWLRDRVESRRDTDWMWLPSAHLRYIAPDALSRRVSTKFDGKRLVSSDAAARDLKVQLSGSHAERLLDKITDLPDYRSAVSFSNIEVDLNDPDLGPLRESVRRWGAFAAHGEQFTHHAQFVQTVISRYARLVESIEALSLRFDPLRRGKRHHAARHRHGRRVIRRDADRDPLLQANSRPSRILRGAVQLTRPVPAVGPARHHRRRSPRRGRRPARRPADRNRTRPRLDARLPARRLMRKHRRPPHQQPADPLRRSPDPHPPEPARRSRPHA